MSKFLEEMELRKVTVPEGESGGWQIDRFTISEDDAKLHNSKASWQGQGGRDFPAGTYTRLTHRNYVIMSDTEAELRDHISPVIEATGKVLINGLGLGVVLQACLSKPEVEHVTVIELSEDVLSLVADHYTKEAGDRLEIIQANAYEYKPPKGARFNMVWHDIWPDLCTDYLKGMGRLNRKYARRADWQGCWCQDLIRYYRKREKAMSHGW